MKNSKCIVCGTEFPPRKGKLFCSDSCKQKHYRMKDDPATVTHRIIEEFKEAGKLEKLDIDLLKTVYLLEKKPLWRIDINEYKAYCEKYGIFDISYYCLWRKNLTGEIKLEEIKEYIELMDESSKDAFSMSTEVEKEYYSFIALIFAGLVEFYYGDKYKPGND